ncbi:Beta-galactosidase 7, partial [Ananas comosus]
MGSRAATTATATIATVAVVWVSWAAVAADASVSRGGGGHEREEVEYDGRALIIEGERRMLFSGSIHYPRSTPSYNFEGRYDLVRFIKEVHAQGLYVSLRIGPFVESEWKYGGFPFWLHDVPGITFRCDNEPFKWHMERFVTKIVDMMKSEELYYPQGGPIIISQIENEYQMVEPAFHQRGPPYVRWAASMAVALQTGVPWMMCKQNDAPDPVINSCNGLICGETFVGPNSPNKPSLWTENWTTKYLVYGKEAKFRSAEDIAFATALFIAKKNGSFVNYYMYHGGTNFGRSASSFVTTGYYDHAPLDEYGLIWQPTWAHLGKLHAAIKLSSEPLLWGTYTNQSFSQFQEAHIFQTNSGKCVAFLVNFNKHHIAAIKFRNTTFELPAKSISVLLNCRNETFNTAKVTVQNGTRSAKIVDHLKNAERWKVFSEEIASIRNAEFTTNQLLEQMSTTKDATDYLWYSVSYNHTPFSGQELLHVESRAHVLHAFVNNEFVGSVHGSHHGPPLIVLDTPIPLVQGQNNISLLSVMVGSP